MHCGHQSCLLGLQAVSMTVQYTINFHFVPDGDEDEDEIVDDDALSQPREEPASLEDLPSDQFDMPKRETSV